MNLQIARIERQAQFVTGDNLLPSQPLRLPAPQFPSSLSCQSIRCPSVPLNRSRSFATPSIAVSCATIPFIQQHLPYIKHHQHHKQLFAVGGMELRGQSVWISLKFCHMQIVQILLRVATLGRQWKLYRSPSPSSYSYSSNSVQLHPLQ